jgi:hypothetical protein
MKKCPRCNGEHLRVCTKARQPWEDDFEKEDFFTKKFTPKKQTRVQLSGTLNVPSAEILSVMTPAGRCLVDSCSDITLARRDVFLEQIQFVESPAIVAHLGGETTLHEVGTFIIHLPGRGTSPLVLRDVYAVEANHLPAGVVALLGVADVRGLGLSLDSIMNAPGCDLARARPRGIFRRMWDYLSTCFRPAHCLPPVVRALTVTRKNGMEYVRPTLNDANRERREEVQPCAPEEEERMRLLGIRRSALEDLRERAR